MLEFELKELENFFAIYEPAIPESDFITIRIKPIYDRRNIFSADNIIRRKANGTNLGKTVGDTNGGLAFLAACGADGAPQAPAASARRPVYWRNGCLTRIVSSRSGPVDTIAIGTPVSASIRFR